MGLRRDELIEKSLDYFMEHGLAGLSLRPLAEQIGTSSRLLIYHFETKDGLVSAVMEELQTRIQKSFATELEKPAARRPQGPMQWFWAWTLRPANLRQVRLLFEVQVLALRNPSAYGHYLQKGSSGWLELIEAALPPSPDRRARATLCAAVLDGLLLEFLATGDARRTGQALNLFTEMMQARPQKP